MVTLSEFSTTKLLQQQKDRVIADFPEVEIIDRPDIWWKNHRQKVKKLFPQYKSPKDFNRNTWVMEAWGERVRCQSGNIITMIGGSTRSGKSSLAVILFDKLMNEICNKRKYNLRELMFYGKEDSISLMRKIPSNTCIFQDEGRPEYGSGRNFRNSVDKTQNLTLAKSKVHKVIVKQVDSPQGMLVPADIAQAQICFFSWDHTMALAEQPEHIIELEKELGEIRDETKIAYNYSAISGEWDKYYEKEKLFNEWLVNEYGPQVAEFFIKSGRAHRALMFTITNNRPYFHGYVAFKTIPKDWLWSTYLVQKEMMELHFMTGSAFGNKHRYYRDLVLHASDFEKTCIKTKGGKPILDKRMLKRFVNTKCSGIPKAVQDEVFDILVCEDIPKNIPLIVM